MEWMEMFPATMQPEPADFTQYMGGEAARCWQRLLDEMRERFKLTPKMTFSTCSGKPGWNIKLQKAGVSFGTLYPDEGAFMVFLVVAYAMQPELEAAWDQLSPVMRARIQGAGDFMKNGRWMMYGIEDERDLADFLAIAQAKWAYKQRKAVKG